MQSLHHYLSILSILFFFSVSAASELSIYEVLERYELPRGLLPNDVKNFSVDESGKFEVYLDRACNAKFENELHYDRNISGTLRVGQIEGLTGISAQELFLWFPVIEIRVDIPSSGLIYFNVGVVSKQFSLSLFEKPKDCLAAPGPDLRDGKQIAQSVSEIMPWKLRYELDQDNFLRTAL